MSLKVREVIYREAEVIDLPGLLAQAQKNSGKSVARICEIVGFSRSYWYLLINGKEKLIAYSTLRKIEAALGVDFGIVLEEKCDG